MMQILELLVAPGELGIAFFAPGFFVFRMDYIGLVPGVVRRILQLADCRFDLAFDLLDRALDLGTGIAGQVPDMTLCVSHHFVDRAFDSVVVHFFPFVVASTWITGWRAGR